MIRVDAIFNKPVGLLRILSLPKKGLLIPGYRFLNYAYPYDILSTEWCISIDNPAWYSKYVLFEWYWTFCNDTRDPVINTRAPRACDLVPRDYRKLI